MARRLFSVIISILLLTCCLVGCGNSGTQSASVEATVQNSNQEDAPVSEPTLTPEPTPVPLIYDTPQRLRELVYLVPSSFSIKSGADSNTYYPTEVAADGLLMVSREPAPLALDVADEETRRLALDEVANGVRASSGVHDFKAEYGAPVLEFPTVHCEYLQSVNGTTYKGMCVLVLLQKCFFSFAALEPESSNQGLVAGFPALLETISLYVPEQDFLLDEETRKAIISLNNSYQYEKIVDLADAYIAEHTPSESDSAYSIKEAAESAVSVLPNCRVVSDDFEGTNTLYGGVDEISKDINFVPCVSSDNISQTRVTVIVGFKKKGWLFFDTLKIKVAENEYITDSFSYDSVTREVLRGSTILEHAQLRLTFDEIEGILNSEAPTMRFEGDDNKMYDHDLKKSELDALRNVSVIVKSCGSIASTVYEWENNNL